MSKAPDTQPVKFVQSTFPDLVSPLLERPRLESYHVVPCRPVSLSYCSSYYSMRHLVPLYAFVSWHLLDGDLYASVIYRLCYYLDLLEDVLTALVPWLLDR